MGKRGVRVWNSFFHEIPFYNLSKELLLKKNAVITAFSNSCLASALGRSDQLVDLSSQSSRRKSFWYTPPLGCSSTTTSSAQLTACLCGDLVVGIASMRNRTYWDSIALCFGPRPENTVSSWANWYCVNWLDEDPIRTMWTRILLIWWCVPAEEHRGAACHAPPHS
jgi:hypothetical protein